MLPGIKAIIPVLNKLYRRYWQFSYLPGRSCILLFYFSVSSRPRIRNNCIFCKKALIIGTKKRHPGWETERQGKNGATKRAGVMKIVSSLFVCFAISAKKKAAKRIIDCLSVTMPFVLAADLAGDLEKKLIV